MKAWLWSMIPYKFKRQKFYCIFFLSLFFYINCIYTVYMDFRWDNKKSKLNKTKHGISFEEAKSVFIDEYARLKHDPDHSIDENRYLLLGISSSLRILIVVHTVIEDDIIRLISARKATKRESKQYRRFRI